MRSIMVSGVHAPVHFRGTEGNNVQKNSTYKKHSDKRSEIALIAGLCCMAAGGAALVAIRARNKNAAKSLMLSFDDFMAALKKADIKEPKALVNDCIDENIIGSGQNSVVYKFSNPLLDNWAMKVIKKDSDLLESFEQPISKISDDFDGVNMGQAIAEIGERVQILKKIPGKSHSIGNWSTRRAEGTPITAEDAGKFLSDVKQISLFPQKSFDSYAGRLKIIDDKGYKADSFNPNNYMINYAKKEIFIVDAYKYNVDAHLNTKYDLLCPLVDYPNFEKFYNVMNDVQKAEYIDATKRIAEKCSIAAQKHKIHSDEEVFTAFIKRIDDREANGDMYTRSYAAMKRILDGAVS